MPNWKPFYEELAEKLRSYQNNRKGLIDDIIRPIYPNTGIKMPTLEANNNASLNDIDPFTVFGLFNRGYTPSNRNIIVNRIKELFSVNASVPTDYTGIPELNKQNATYYYFSDHPKRKPGNIDNLWDLFCAALDYKKTKSPSNFTALEQAYDKVIAMDGIGNAKITMGLFWIAPDLFLSLDKTNKDYINSIPSLKNVLPPIRWKMPFKDYWDIVQIVQDYLNQKGEGFVDLSAKAYEQKNTGKRKGVVEEAEPILFNLYNEKKFLDEVFMEKDAFDKLLALLPYKQNVILQGAPGTGKTFTAKRLAYALMEEKDDRRVCVIQFHQSYSYEDFIEGYRPTSNGFKLQKGVFYDFCQEARSQDGQEYFFIIDEVNRGNISRILGEAFMLLEKDKRDEESVKLMYSNEEFSIPGNVYVIGTMNTADRSLAMIDYALRRRFAFFTLKPGFETPGFSAYQQSINDSKLDALIECIIELNEELASDESLGEDFCIGHSFFCGLEELKDPKDPKNSKFHDRLNAIVEYELIPLLQEYWFDQKDKAVKWSEKLKDAIQ